MLYKIREIGLTNVTMSVPVTLKGQKGRILMSADISPRPGSDVEKLGDFSDIEKPVEPRVSSSTNHDVRIMMPDPHRSK